MVYYSLFMSQANVKRLKDLAKSAEPEAVAASKAAVDRLNALLSTQLEPEKSDIIPAAACAGADAAGAGAGAAAS